MDLTLIVAPPCVMGRAVPRVLPVIVLFAALFAALPASAGFRYVAPTGGFSQQPMQPYPQSMASANVPPPPVAMHGGSVQGFANQVPLPVALRQILPRGVAFSIADNIDTGTKVNWQGGQSWQQTLEAMLAPAGLQAVYTSNKVLVTRNALAPVAMTPSAPRGLKPPVDRITPTEIGSSVAPLPEALPEVAPEPLPDAVPVSLAAAPLTPLPVAEDPQPMVQPVAMAAPIALQPVTTPMPEPVMETVEPQPLPVVEAAPVITNVPVAAPMAEPYIASSTGPAASLMPPGSAGGNATIGAVQDAPPVVASAATMAPLPEAQVANDPRPAPIGNAVAEVPGTELGNVPPLVMQPAQTSVAPGNVSETAPVASTLAALDTQPVVAANPWEAHSGQTLHETLADWSKRAGVELNWLSEYDYPIQASLTFSGSFEEAVRTLLGGFANAAPQPVGRLHRNEQLGQQALIIEMRGNAYDD